MVPEYLMTLSIVCGSPLVMYLFVAVAIQGYEKHCNSL
ncbi:hypothetical protein tloyanaT_22010 [Thalassotalea loyana]|uniref:Uncharacterized protein n=1 Tax=Thalassotalea loyana TaxID=280483 RepID=A0ABQ6HD76_9GAMM|nr:hypothetical protein tloyanaT_22010 [Thalassotalea loyana]